MTGNAALEQNSIEQATREATVRRIREAFNEIYFEGHKINGLVAAETGGGHASDEVEKVVSNIYNKLEYLAFKLKPWLPELEDPDNPLFQVTEQKIEDVERYCLIEEIGGAKRRVKHYYITKQQDDEGKVSWVVSYPPMSVDPNTIERCDVWEHHISNSFEGAKSYGAQLYNAIKGEHNALDGTVRLLYWDEEDQQ